MGKKGFSEGMGGERAVKSTARVGNPLSTFPGDWRFRMLGQKAVNTVKNGGYLVYGKMFWMFVCLFFFFSQGLMDDLELVARKEP